MIWTRNGKYYFEKTSEIGYDEIKEDGFPEGMPRVKLNGKYGIIRATDGSYLIPAICDSIKFDVPKEYEDERNWPSFIGNIICYIVSINGKFGTFDEKGHPLIPCKYAYLSSLRNYDNGYSSMRGFYRIKLNGKVGTANRVGEVAWEV